MKENFPNLVKEIDIQVQETQRVPNKLDPKGPYQDTSQLKCQRLKIKRESFFKKILYLFIFRGRGREGERERERNINVQEIYKSVASSMPLTGNLAYNPGMCPDWDSNWQPLCSQAGTQSTEPYQPG